MTKSPSGWVKKDQMREKTSSHSLTNTLSLRCTTHTHTICIKVAFMRMRMAKSRLVSKEANMMWEGESEREDGLHPPPFFETAFDNGWSNGLEMKMLRDSWTLYVCTPSMLNEICSSWKRRKEGVWFGWGMKRRPVLFSSLKVHPLRVSLSLYPVIFGTCESHCISLHSYRLFPSLFSSSSSSSSESS